jgi:hypothetical protein
MDNLTLLGTATTRSLVSFLPDNMPAAGRSAALWVVSPPTWMPLQLTSSQDAMTSSNTTPVLRHLSMLMALHLPLT